MRFEWDERKRQEVLRRRGVDLLDAALIFEGVVLTRVDERKDYGERRLVSLGMADGEPFFVVHVERNGATRLITAWRGGRDDVARYQAGIARRDQGDEGPG
jgi:uncharacterized DUF497 family protein